jgi:16S rRNA (guanine(966)-N(2))-methyltransferase RsmD
LWTRPTSDRTRTILFDILGGKVSGAVGLDVFAGSGALGIEALSRGASQVDFVEKSRRAAEIIRRNLQHTHLEDHARVMVADAFAFLDRAGCARGRTLLGSAVEGNLAYDLVFADPPYGMGYSGRLLEAFSSGGILNAGAVVVVEESARIELDQERGKLCCFLRRVVGETALHFYEAS